MTDNFLKSLNAMKGNTDFNNPESVARYFKNLSEILKEVETRLEEPKNILLTEGKTFFFPEDEVKVSFQEGRTTTVLNAEKIADDFVFQKRVDDLKKVISISEKSLRDNVPDAEMFIAKYKEVTGTTKPSVSVKPLTKAELKEIKG